MLTLIRVLKGRIRYDLEGPVRSSGRGLGVVKLGILAVGVYSG